MSAPLTEARDDGTALHRVQVLPYWRAYSGWTRHLDGCGPCLVVVNGGSGQTDDLCEWGRFWQDQTAFDIEWTAAVAAQN